MPPPVNVWLRKKGFEVVTLTAAGLFSAADTKIAAYAAAHNLVVLTKDNDFGRLYHDTYRRRLTVVLIRTKKTDPLALIAVIERVHLKLNLRKLQNQLVLASEKKIRVVF